MVHRSAFIGCLAHGTHARLLLNHHVETGASGDVEALVRNDVVQLRRLPATVLTETAIARILSRVAYLRGDRERAIQLLRTSLERFDETLILQEIAHDRYTLGLLIGGAEGAPLAAAANQALGEYGVSDPEACMRGYVPELLTQRSISSG
jgi:hypothetical protein